MFDDIFFQRGATANTTTMPFSINLLVLFSVNTYTHTTAERDWGVTGDPMYLMPSGQSPTNNTDMYTITHFLEDTSGPLPTAQRSETLFRVGKDEPRAHIPGHIVSESCGSCGYNTSGPCWHPSSTLCFGFLSGKPGSAGQCQRGLL